MERCGEVVRQEAQVKRAMVKKQDREGTAELILAAATRVFVQHGYHGTSMSAITRAAGINKALIFYYFESKEGLFDAVVKRVYALQTDALSRVSLASGLSPRERVHALIDYYWNFMERHPEVLRLSLHEVARPDGRHAVIAEQNRMVFELLQSQMRPFDTSFPSTVEHLFLSIASAIIYPVTHAPIFTHLADSYLSTEAARQARRTHVHWLVDLAIDQLRLHDETTPPDGAPQT